MTSTKLALRPLKEAAMKITFEYGETWLVEAEGHKSKVPHERQWDKLGPVRLKVKALNGSKKQPRPYVMMHIEVEARGRLWAKLSCT